MNFVDVSRCHQWLDGHNQTDYGILATDFSFPKWWRFEKPCFILCMICLDISGLISHYASLRDAYYCQIWGETWNSIHSIMPWLFAKQITNTKPPGPLHLLPVPDLVGLASQWIFVGPLPLETKIWLYLVNNRSSWFWCMYQSLPSQILMQKTLPLYFSTTGTAKWLTSLILSVTVINIHIEVLESAN